MSKAQILENHAYSTPQRNRVVGSPGLEASLKYIKDTVTALDYYDVTTQEFTVLGAGEASLSITGTKYDSLVFGGSPKGAASAQLVAVADLGCNTVGPLSPCIRPRRAMIVQQVSDRYSD